MIVESVQPCGYRRDEQGGQREEENLFDNFDCNDNEVDSDDAGDNEDVVDDDHEQTAPAGDGAAGGRLEGDEEGGPRAEHTKRAAYKTFRYGEKICDRMFLVHMGDLGKK